MYSLVNKYSIDKTNIKYLVRLIDEHGIEVLRGGTKQYYWHEFKLEVIIRILTNI